MPRFALRFPYFIIVGGLMAGVLGISALLRMPVDLFPAINIPVVMVATFYSGMPPKQIETAITAPFERMFTLASDVDHIESRSLPGVSLIKVHFHPGSNPDSALTGISNLAMATLRRLPQGTLPPVILKSDASSMPVCLVTFKGQGLAEKDLLDIARFNVRNQMASVPGASVPLPFGGKMRQIQVYVDPMKMQAYDLSIDDVVNAVNDANLILPAGFSRIGDLTYNIYTNSQVATMRELDQVPLRTVGQGAVMVGDVGRAKDDTMIQTNIVRIDGQRSVYVPVLKQGGNTNTIAIVDGIKDIVSRLLDVPKTLMTEVIFDQSLFVKSAIENLMHEGLTGLCLTGLMILMFLGSPRATGAVMLSIPLSALTMFFVMFLGGGSVNTMLLGGLALAFSRLIDNSVIVLENIFRHMEMGKPAAKAAEQGGMEVSLPVLAATLTMAIVFFPVSFLQGVSKFLFSALGLAVVVSEFASYVVAMTVVPLFCSRFITNVHGNGQDARSSLLSRFNTGFDARFQAFLDRYQALLARALQRPRVTLAGITGLFAASLLLFPLLGLSFFPRTDPGLFTLMIKAPSGMRLEKTEDQIRQVEALIRRNVTPEDLQLILSNIGSVADLPALYTTNSTEDTAFVQVALKAGHKTSSFEYMDRIGEALREEMPQLSTYLQTSGLIDAVMNQGMPAPIDVQVGTNDLETADRVVKALTAEIRKLPGTGDVFTPQDNHLPAFNIEVDRIRAGQVGLTEKNVVDSLISALTSNVMISPNYWIDPKSGNNYFLSVQYPLELIRSINDLRNLVLRGPNVQGPTTLDSVARIEEMHTPNEVDHYQIRRVMDIYVTPQGEDLGRLATAIEDTVAGMQLPEGVTVTLRGAVQSMRASFHSFALGLSLSVILVYLVLVAQFRSFVTPFIILLAVPTGLTGVILMLLLSGTTLNVMSLMGVLMLCGMVVSNSILIVEFTHQLRAGGMTVVDAVSQACRTRLRPVLMTSLATIIGLIPMALKLGTGSEAYAPLARVIIGGLSASVVLTVFIVPATYVLLFRDRNGEKPADSPPEATT
ncbi:efflux RND transporter permease subunit [Methylococcus capsulatus]|uniref:efflux RND transporter permease subunit n=1 Tax=Methylococcus capsulatus TaxID=414 RepID=UPI001C527277|nr:efflux RND transporter permease subunit [Methylococcus capsulatus]QXP87624.1 efflux RND transporter permease subunit [Methylococcus capsulatus]QXP92636.1 efflux RND transporter permease subunit [Methylococcus capsulatus]UQN12640.1 efflux RND transporter permease subunit [Methylococcus capsulatus]